MDRQRFARRHFTVMGASGVEVVRNYLSADYCLSEISDDARTGDTGRLQLFRIDPISRVKHPAFVVRIGHDDHEAVDVDLLGDEQERIAFRTQAPGYKGHKAQALGANPRSYKLDIEVRSVGKVFSGIVTMKGVHLGLRLEGQMKLDASFTVDLQHIHKPSEH